MIKRRRMIALLLCLFLAAVSNSYAGGTPDVLTFKNLSINDGLSNLNVTAIVEDNLGYMWIGTRRGLNRFNGYEFDHFFIDADDPSSLPSNNINTLYTANDGVIYIGTTNGLGFYDNRIDKIDRLFPGFSGSIVDIKSHNNYIYIGSQRGGIFRFHKEIRELERIGHNWDPELHVNTLYIDPDGLLYATFAEGKGFAIYDDQSKSFDFYTYDEKSEKPNSNSFTWIFQAADNLLMLGATNGIYYFDKIERTFVWPDEFASFTESLEGIGVNILFQYRNRQFWAGTETDGLFSFDRITSNLYHYLMGNTQGQRTHSKTYHAYCIDSHGNLWLGTFDNGLDVFFKDLKRFNFDQAVNELIKQDFVTEITKDLDNRLLLATRKNGFYIYDQQTNTSELISPSNSGLHYPYIRALAVDQTNRYWIGTDFGLQVFDPSNRSFQTIPIHLPSSSIVTLHQNNGKIFAGSENQGILVFDLAGNLLFRSTIYGINIPRINHLNEMEVFFVGYENGLYAMNIVDFSVRKISFPAMERYPGLRSTVTAFVDKDDIIWLGTYNHGLFRLDINNSTVTSFGLNDGLPSSDVLGIEEDDRGYLWLSTSFGLANLRKSDFLIRSFSYKEGLNNYQFHEKASFKDELGIIYFGGNYGLTYFNPAEIDGGILTPPRIIFDNLYINNERVFAYRENAPIRKSIAYTDKIRLTHRSRIITIGYLAFDFFNPDNIKYYYKLEGFDKDWNEAGTQRRATYSNLRRGKYSFMVKARNSSGQWSEDPAVVDIHVIPAPWFSSTAWLVYLLTFIAGVMIISRMYVRAAVAEKRLELEQFEHERDQEINDMKRRFFTNIAHEFRTPLTLLGAIFKQIGINDSKANYSVGEYIQMAGLNVERMLKLVNQLLAFKMLESDVLNLWVKNQNLNNFIHAIVKEFEVLAREKSIEVHVIEDNSYSICFDSDIIEKIMTNLLSNAVKHSLEGGQIEVSLKKIHKESVLKNYPQARVYKNKLASEYIEVSVSDNGKGIDKESLKHIFERYKKSASSLHGLLSDHSSIGIGLNFTRRLVELHHGLITVASTQGRGSTFSFVIPADNSLYDSSCCAEIQKEQEMYFPNIHLPVATNADIEIDFEKTILVVEDDPHLNTFLRNSIKHYYNVITAYNGEDALDSIRKKQPDIIVTDVVMPRMDGMELLKTIKQSDEFCHIPVIMLTSKSEVSDQIEGLKTGADHYIAKPFDIDYLVHAIDNQLANRKRLQKIFHTGMMPEMKEYDGNQAAKHFLEKLNVILEEEVSNTELDISFVSEKLNMSRSSFYRKFLCLTSITPIAYIRKFRINKSIELMNQGEFSIQDISDRVGFGSPSYFSTAFKQEKNMTPSEYMSHMKVNADD